MKTPWRFVVLMLTGTVLLFATACSDSEYTIGGVIPALGIVGNGIVVEKSRAISPFSRLDLRGVGTVHVNQGAREELSIRAEENLLQYLRTDVRAGELVIWKDAVSILNTRPIEYRLTVVDLERVMLTGAGRIEASSLDTGPLALWQSGVGSIEFANLSAPEVDVESFGLGDIVVSGSADAQTIRLNNFGSYDGREFASSTADVRIGNGGSATVQVRDYLRATINGSGNIYYIGDPVVDSTINGSGNVVPIGR